MPEDLFEKIIDFQRGNNYAFTQIYIYTHNLVYRCIFQMVKNESDTNDLVQIVYLKLYKKLPTLDNATKFQSWLLSIVYNETKNFLKSKQRTHKYIDDSFDISDEADAISVCDYTQDIEEQFEFNETNDILKGLIELLPEEQRDVLYLYYFEEKDVSAIAEELLIPKGTVKSRLNYARKNLKRSIENYESSNQVRLHSAVLVFLNVEYLSSVRHFGKILTAIPKAAPVMISTVAVGACVGGTLIYSNFADKPKTDFTSSKQIAYSYENETDSTIQNITENNSEFYAVQTESPEKKEDISVTTARENTQIKQPHTEMHAADKTSQKSEEKDEICIEKSDAPSDEINKDKNYEHNNDSWEHSYGYDYGYDNEHDDYPYGRFEWDYKKIYQDFIHEPDIESPSYEYYDHYDDHADDSWDHSYSEYGVNDPYEPEYPELPECE